MNYENPTERDLERLFTTAIAAQDALKLLCCNGDDATASLAGIFLERACRSGIDGLMQLATERPEALYHRASMCVDWPGFIPEHKASRDANVKMFKVLGVGSALSYKLKDANLGSPLQEFVALLYLQLSHARAMWSVDNEIYGPDALPEWRHEAAQLPELPGSIDDRKKWFECSWKAFECSLDGHPMAEDEYILKLGKDCAEQKALNRKHKKLSRLRKKMKLLDRGSDVENGIKLSVKEMYKLSQLQDEIARIESSEPDIWAGDIVACARFSIQTAFLGRVGG
jgi:hypothetical protein